MGNITMVDGHVPDGSYQNVTANGSCSCDAGMRFDGLRARGSFDAMGLDGGNVHCEGRLVCRGDMHVTDRHIGMLGDNDAELYKMISRLIYNTYHEQN